MFVNLSVNADAAFASFVQTPRHRAIATLSLFALLLTAGCDTQESKRIDETRESLAGTWMQEAAPGDVTVRRLLVLGKEGAFTEQVAVATTGSPAERTEFAGEWSYDGASFKRRYMRENGRQYAGGGIRFATFPLVSASKSEFVVDDNIRGAKVTFRRVGEGTRL